MKKKIFFTFLRVTMRFHDVFFVSLSVRSDIMRKVVSPDTCIMYLIHKHQDYLSRRAHGGRVSVNLNVRIRRGFREVNAIIRVLLRQLDSTENSPTSLYFTYRFTISTLQFRYENRFAERKISSRDPYPIFTDRYLVIFLTRRLFEILLKFGVILAIILHETISCATFLQRLGLKIFATYLSPPVFLEYAPSLALSIFTTIYKRFIFLSIFVDTLLCVRSKQSRSNRRDIRQ